MDQIISQLITSYHIKKTSDNTFEVITDTYDKLVTIKLSHPRIQIRKFHSKDGIITGWFEYV